MSYEHILNSGDIDAKFEYFWYMFKSSVASFAQKYPQDTEFKRLTTETFAVSDRLNQLKIEGKYDEIIDTIELFLEDYFWSCLRVADTKYHIDICYTNIKRWININRILDNRVVKDVSIEMHVLRVTYDALDKDTIGITADIKEFHQIFPDGLRGHLRSIVDTLINYAIINRFPPILNKMCEHYVLKRQLIEYVKCIYGIDLPKQITNGQKILSGLAGHLH